MRAVFADTLYWVAIARAHDQWHQAAVSARNALGSLILVTTEEVLAEFLNAFSRTPELRHAAALTVRSILNDVNTVVVPQSHSGFLEALNRFERRRDKNYSLVDCHSMNIMESEGIDAVLTNDHHFQQEGFTVLIRRAD